VVQLIVFCALIGMLLAQPRLPDPAVRAWPLAATAGHLAGGQRGGGLQLPGRAAHRPPHGAHRLAPHGQGRAQRRQTLLFSAVLCAMGSAVLYVWVNPLTMWLTFATFVGYAVIYTVVLKPLTPQNIVIGGASGAMPPVLGWAAMTGEVGPEALAAVPDHLPVDAAALLGAGAVPHRGLPQGRPADAAGHARPEFTRLQVLLYTVVLFAATCCPSLHGMSGWLYLLAA
jgi:protoheme IX farnesyltransferase